MRTWRMLPWGSLEKFLSELIPVKLSGIGTESAGIPEFRSECATELSVNGGRTNPL